MTFIKRLFPQYRKREAVIVQKLKDENNKYPILVIEGRRFFFDRMNFGWNYRGFLFNSSNSSTEFPVGYMTTAQWFPERTLIPLSVEEFYRSKRQLETQAGLVGIIPG